MTSSASARVLLSVLALSVAGCTGSGDVITPSDPWEGTNRRIDAFNTAIDKATLKPLAKGYRTIIPGVARRGVSNFFDNLATPATAVNNFLQGKPGQGFNDIGRFLANSTIGIGGLLDPGTAMGLQDNDEDFGQTLAVWGVGDGPFVMLPFLGPATLRDAIAKPVDFISSPLYHYDNTSAKDKLRVLEIIDQRSGLLSAEGFLEDSNDPYITLRESYLQNREYKIYDGDPPVDDDFYDDFLEEDDGG